MQNARPLILVIDDDSLFRQTAKQQLSKLGYQFIEANNGLKGVQLSIQHRPDIILLDDNMPVQGGIETCEIIAKQSAGIFKPQVLMITENDSCSFIDACFHAGAIDYFMKPINWTALKYRAANIIKTMRLEERLKNQTALLDKAHKIAKMAHFNWNLHTDHQLWSKNINQLFNWPEDQPFSIHQLEAVISSSEFSAFNAIKALQAPQSYNFEFCLSSASYRSMCFKVFGELSTNTSNQTIFTATIQDITEKTEQNNTIWQQANFDPLTQLNNRNAFITNLEHDLKLAHYENHSLGIMIIDLDEFKNINDSLGHDVGDLILVAIAQRLKALSAENIGFSRLGGDEFAVLVSNYNDIQELAQLAEKLLIEITKPIVFDRKELSLTGSIGIAIYPNDGEDSSQLLKHADTAMYNAKTNGRNHYAFFDVQMLEQVFLRNQMEQNIRRALSKGEFTLVFQPLIHLSSGRINGIEALIRWFDPEEKRWISPDKFIPTAELSNLISEIDQWVMEELFKQIAQWFIHKPDLDLNKISFNITGRTLSSPAFKSTLESLTLNQNYRPHLNRVALEITERTLFDADKNKEIFDDIRRLGMRIAIDDFGTGFSSLNSLANLPANDILKIDKSFIDRIGTNNKADALIRGIISLANSLEIDVIAEGVETAEQFSFLDQAGCDYIQGYYISKGLNAEAFCSFYDQFTVQ